MAAHMFPTLSQFSLFLTEQKDVLLTSAMKSYFTFIIDYFQKKPFTEENLRIMLNLLRTSTQYKDKPLKKSTLNKYIRVAKLIDQCMKTHVLDNYQGYRCYDEDTSPKGDLITDKEAKMIAECRIKMKHRSKEQLEHHHIKYLAMFTMMRFLGTPPVDIVNLKWSNYKITHFDYFRHKTHKHMIVPVPSLLRQYMSELPHIGDYIFTCNGSKMKEESIRQEIRRRCEKLKITKNVTPYSFRYMATGFSYMNCKDNNITHLADVFGHTVEVAKKHYNLVQDPQILLDALMTSHPGLKKDTSIDSVKRLALDFLARLIDSSKFEVELTIQPKARNVRHITLS